MKNKYLIYLALFTITIISVSCKDKNTDPDPTELEIQLEALMNNNSSWGLNGGSVIKDGYDVSSQFDGFILSIGEFTYATENGLTTAWPTQGTWQFVNENPNKIKRDDGVDVDVTVANNQLTLTFTVTDIGGRGNGIDGVYKYKFNLTSN
jgi:hypothetical protein